ncbi:hypothetical protein [Neisseria sp.]|uniref:hypothetical protein n=1 Tax=Neisseria sp. TaxID=192066 RepID=UPI0035A0058C
MGRHVAVPKPCSCRMCGNPRKLYGNGKEAKTVQELCRREQEKAASCGERPSEKAFQTAFTVSALQAV